MSGLSIAKQPQGIQWRTRLPMACRVLVNEDADSRRQREYQNLQLLELLALLEQSVNWSEDSVTAPALRVMDAKLNVLIDLTQRLLGFHKMPMPEHDLELSSLGLACALLRDSDGPVLLDMQIHAMVEQPLSMLVERDSDGDWLWQFDNDVLRDAWEKWLFRQHRRWIAASKAEN